MKSAARAETAKNDSVYRENRLIGHNRIVARLRQSGEPARPLCDDREGPRGCNYCTLLCHELRIHDDVSSLTVPITCSTEAGLMMMAAKMAPSAAEIVVAARLWRPASVGP